MYFYASKVLMQLILTLFSSHVQELHPPVRYLKRGYSTVIIRRNGIVLQIATILLIALVSLFSTSCAGSNHLYKEAYSSYIYKDYTHAMELLDSIIKNDRGYTQAYLLL